MGKDEIEFGSEGVEQNVGLGIDDFGTGNFLKNPNLGESITFTVVRVEKSDKTEGKNKETGKSFTIGLQQKDGKKMRYDIVTDAGVYTISNWEIYFKLFGPDGVLRKYATQNNGGFAGAKINIKRIVEGLYVNYKAEDLSKIKSISVSEAKTMIEGIKLAIKEQRLFEVTVK
jgi:hypothetical protein